MCVVVCVWLCACVVMYVCVCSMFNHWPAFLMATFVTEVHIITVT